jgi:hypothetical protein
VAQQDPTPMEALSEMQEILRSAASEGSSARLPAVRYTVCRETLLKSDMRPLLPGFLIQCLTFSRFHDFIRLYHPQVEKRVAFIDSEFQTCAGRVKTRPRFDIFDDPEF